MVVPTDEVRERLPELRPAPDEARTPTVSFSVEGRPSGEAASHLADRAVFVSYGDSCAPGAMRGPEAKVLGLVRASCACYSTREEVRRPVGGVPSIAES